MAVTRREEGREGGREGGRARTRMLYSAREEEKSPRALVRGMAELMRAGKRT